MHLRAVIVSIGAVGIGALSGCGSSSPAEVVVEPGVTAIGESNALACSTDLRTLQMAIENYTLLEGDPPTAEADLVPDWLRSESQLYDIAAGAIVPASGTDCPPAEGTGDPAIAPECAARYKTLQVASDAFYAKNGVGVTVTEDGLVADGLLRVLDEHYDIDAGGQIVAVPGGPCDGVPIVLDTTTSVLSTTTTAP
ncbi:MAG: hypothetical protein ACRDIL_22410 [Candidatus Limnocylindrales bacterium]